MIVKKMKHEGHRPINDIIAELEQHPDYMFSNIMTITDWINTMLESIVDEPEVFDVMEKDGIVSFDEKKGDYILHRPDLFFDQKFWKSQEVKQYIGSIVCEHYNYGLPWEEIHFNYKDGKINFHILKWGEKPKYL